MYYVKKICGYILSDQEIESAQKGFLDVYQPPTVPSKRWRHWVTTGNNRVCLTCERLHGEIYAIEEEPPQEPPIHDYCKCSIKPMEAVFAGTGTKDGNNGADWWMKHLGTLPDYYITQEEIRALGWRDGKSPVKYAPGKMIYGEIYRNEDKHLPQALGRIWYEADINYYEGRRNKHRLLWSNDGLFFVTYDHYKTFYEII